MKRKIILGIAIIAWAFLMVRLSDGSTPPAESGAISALQSVLPTPANPFFVNSLYGGQIYCGLQQSSAWLEVPGGFSSEGGAEFRCDPVSPLFQWNNTQGAWDDRGYLIAFYPIQTPILRPFNLILEIDPARTANVCDTCFNARYYNQGIGQWQALPTYFDRNKARVSIEIAQYLPGSGYPGYDDRFLIALFVLTEFSPTPTISPTPIPTAEPTDTAVSTSSPTSSLTPTRASPTPLPASPIPMPSPTTPPLPTPSLTPVPPSATPAVSSTVTPTPDYSSPEPPVERTQSPVAFLLILIVLSSAWWFYLLRRRRKREGG